MSLGDLVCRTAGLGDLVFSGGFILGEAPNSGTFTPLRFKVDNRHPRVLVLRLMSKPGSFPLFIQFLTVSELICNISRSSLL